MELNELIMEILELDREQDDALFRVKVLQTLKEHHEQALAEPEPQPEPPAKKRTSFGELARKNRRIKG